MKSIVFAEDSQFDTVKEDVPALRPGQVMVKPAAVGICFTEKHYYEGRWGYYPVGTRLGHEAAGEVVEVGDDVTALRVGQRVCVDPKPRCGQCLMCRGGHHSYYPKLPYTCQVEPEERSAGLMTEYAPVAAYKCRPIPDSMSWTEAANVEPFANGTRAARHSGFAIGDNVVFLGMEDYAYAAVQWFRNGGAGTIIVADPVESRRKDALRVGADVAITPAEVADVVAEHMPFGADIAFAAMETYLPETADYLSAAVEHTRLMGTVVVQRVYNSEALQRVDAPKLWMKELTLKGFGFCWGEETWRGGDPRGDFQVTIEAIERGHLDAASHVRNVPFDEITSRADLDTLMSGMPHNGSKIHITMQ